MAKKASSTKTVTYRSCMLGSKHPQNLQQLVSSALSQIPIPAKRRESLAADSEERRVIGNHQTINECLCGYVTTWVPGASQTVIEDHETAKTLKMSSLPPPTAKTGEAQKQFVPGALYFVIYGNHVAFISTLSLRSSSLEAHLNWLLKTKTKVLDKSVPLILSDEVGSATKAKIKKSHVKSIAFNQPLFGEIESVPVDNTAANDRGVVEVTQSQFQAKSGMWGMIQSLIGDQKEIASLGLDDVFDSHFEVWIQIKHPKRQRSKPENAVKLMDTLGIAFRDVEGDEVTLELENGNRISGRDLKISGKVTAKLVQNNLFDEQDVLTQISLWLRNQIKAGAIGP